MNDRGFTLAEIVIAIVVLAIASAPFLVGIATLVRSSAEGQIPPVAAMLAQELMEEITSKRYDENSESPWTQRRYLGPDGGEGNRSDFDDVDDFNGWEESGISGFPSYSSTVNVYYVNSGDLNTQASIGPNSYTDFKKIMVRISHGGKERILLVTATQGY